MAVAELRTARTTAGVSQRAIARLLGWSQSRYSEFERGLLEPTIVELCEVAAVVGLRPSLSLHPEGEPVRDAGQLALTNRFLACLAPGWLFKLEAPFPTLGDLRSWDLLIRLGSRYRVGVEAETRIRDIQELVRRIRQRELHGGVDHILVILSDSQHNRRHADDLRAALGPNYAGQPSDLTAAVKAGQPLPGSGVILL